MGVGTGRGDAHRIAFFAALVALAPSRELAAQAAPGPEPERIGLRLVVRDGELLVTTVVRGLPAADAGVRVGDALLAVDGQPVHSREEAAAQLARFGEVTRMTLRLRPPSRARVLVVGTAPEPIPEPPSAAHLDDPGSEPGGPALPPRAEVITATRTATAARPYLGLGFDQHGDGVFIGRVVDGSPAGLLRLRVGDELLTLDGEEVSTAAVLRGRIARLVPGAQVRVVTRAPPIELELIRPRRKPDAARPHTAATTGPTTTAQTAAAGTGTSLGDQPLIGQAGFTLLVFGADAGAFDLSGGGAGGRARLLVGHLPPPDGGGVFAFDAAADLTLGAGVASLGFQSETVGVLMTRVEAGLYAGGFSSEKNGAQAGFGVRAGGALLIATALSGGADPALGFGLHGGLVWDRYSVESGRMFSVILSLTVPVPQDSTSVLANLQFLF